MPSNSWGRRTSTIVALAVCAAILFAHTEDVSAAGGLKPSQAPLVKLGQHYFGNTNNATTQYPVELWRLPTLLTGDVITVIWQAHYAEVGGPTFCLIQNVDDFNWAESQNRCNASEEYGVPDYGDGSTRSVVQVRAATSDAFLEFGGCGSGCEFGTYDGAYNFTIESIQHAVGVGLSPRGYIRTRAVLRANANLADGSPMPDGSVFYLTANWGKTGSALFAASSSGGNISFPVSLPPETIGESVTFTVTRPADAQYLAARSAGMAVQIARNKRPVTKTHHRHRRCRRGFHKRRIRGHIRCVRIKHRH